MMKLKNQILNKVYLISLFYWLSTSCLAVKKEKQNLNFILDLYISYYSPKYENFNSQKKYLFIGSVNGNNDSINNVISISDGCFECLGMIRPEDAIIQYRGFKIVIASDNVENKIFILNNLKNTQKAERFSVKAFNNNVMYDFPRYWEIQYDKQGKISFICMGEKTKEIKQLLNLDRNVKDCQD